MPPSAAKGHSPDDAPGQALAVAAESLFLVNLMLAPGLGFLAIAWLWWQRRHAAPALARCHLDQAFYVSLWGGVLIVIASAAIVTLGGLQGMWTWVAVIIYFTCIHSTLIVFGCIGLAHAMAGKPYRYPIIGVGHD
jgi:hypothetical protein